MGNVSKVQISGGLGNQLFQVFFTRYLSERFQQSRKYILDCARISKQTEHHESSILNLNELPSFAPVETTTPPQDKVLRATDLGLRRILRSRPTKFLDQLSFRVSGTVFERNGDLADDFFEKVCASKRVVGYFQKSLYFRLLDEQSQRQFLALIPDNEEELDTRDKLAVHIRRGDYVGHHRFKPLPLDYFQRGISLVGAESKDVLVFSDSSDSKEIRDFCSINGFSLASNHSPVQALSAFSKARALVISNSSLSLAGAVVNPDADMVVAPKYWSRSETPQSTRDKYCDHFVISD